MTDSETPDLQELPPETPADPVPTGSPAANDAPETAAVEVSAAEVSATEVSASLTSKLQELEERLAVEPPTVEAPPVKPAKKTPAKKATKAPAARKAPAKKAAPPTMELATEAPAPPRATRPPKLQRAVHAEPVVPPPTLPEAPPRTTTPGSGRGMKAAIALIVLLLAAAAGLGAAAVVHARPSTWESRAIVQLTGGVAAADPVTDRVQGVGKYRLTVANSSFTALSAFKAGVKDDQVRKPIVGLPRGPGQILLVARADTADHTDALIAAAARNLVEAVTSDQALRVAAPDARLTASTTGRIGDAEQVKPTDEDAMVAGALAAGAVLVLGLAVVFLRREKDSKK